MYLGTNAALDYVDDVKGTFEEIAIVKAAGLCFASFLYFQLVNFIRGLIIIIRKH